MKPQIIKTGKSFGRVNGELLSLAETLNNTFPLVHYHVRMFGANGLKIVGESMELIFLQDE